MGAPAQAAVRLLRVAESDLDARISSGSLEVCAHVGRCAVADEEQTIHS